MHGWLKVRMLSKQYWHPFFFAKGMQGNDALDVFHTCLITKSVRISEVSGSRGFTVLISIACTLKPKIFSQKGISRETLQQHVQYKINENIIIHSIYSKFHKFIKAIL